MIVGWEWCKIHGQHGWAQPLPVAEFPCSEVTRDHQPQPLVVYRWDLTKLAAAMDPSKPIKGSRKAMGCPRKGSPGYPGAISWEPVVSQEIHPWQLSGSSTLPTWSSEPCAFGTLQRMKENYWNRFLIWNHQPDNMLCQSLDFNIKMGIRKEVWCQKKCHRYLGNLCW